MANKHLDNSWDGFRYFLAVARTGTLSAAAASLGTEHTTVSRHIRILEDDVRSQLFHRSNQGYDLTDAGQRFLLKAEAVESAIVSARVIAAEDAQIAGTVRIGAPDGFGTIFLSPLLGELTKRYPNLNVEIFAIPRQFSLSKREADIAIRLSAPQQIRVVSRRLTDYHLYVYASREYLDSSAPIATRDDLQHHPFVSYSEELVYSREVDYLNVIGPDVAAHIRSMSLVAQAYAALGGAGLCILPGFVERAFPNLMAVLPEKVSLVRSFHMHIHEDHKKAPHIRAVAGFIAEKVEAHAELFRAKHLDAANAL